jgi:biotin carboxyl carrier protein
MVTALERERGKAVAKGDKLATLEAMKMQTNILARPTAPSPRCS